MYPSCDTITRTLITVLTILRETSWAVEMFRDAVMIETLVSHLAALLEHLQADPQSQDVNILEHESGQKPIFLESASYQTALQCLVNIVSLFSSCMSCLKSIHCFFLSPVLLTYIYMLRSHLYKLTSLYVDLAVATRRGPERGVSDVWRL